MATYTITSSTPCECCGICSNGCSTAFDAHLLDFGGTDNGDGTYTVDFYVVAHAPCLGIHHQVRKGAYTYTPGPEGRTSDLCYRVIALSSVYDLVPPEWYVPPLVGTDGCSTGRVNFDARWECGVPGPVGPAPEGGTAPTNAVLKTGWMGDKPGDPEDGRHALITRYFDGTFGTVSTSALFRGCQVWPNPDSFGGVFYSAGRAPYPGLGPACAGVVPPLPAEDPRDPAYDPYRFPNDPGGPYLRLGFGAVPAAGTADALSLRLYPKTPYSHPWAYYSTGPAHGGNYGMVTAVPEWGRPPYTFELLTGQSPGPPGDCNGYWCEFTFVGSGAASETVTIKVTDADGNTAEASADYPFFDVSCFEYQTVYEPVVMYLEGGAPVLLGYDAAAGTYHTPCDWDLVPSTTVNTYYRYPCAAYAAGQAGGAGVYCLDPAVYYVTTAAVTQATIDGSLHTAGTWTLPPGVAAVSGPHTVPPPAPCSGGVDYTTPGYYLFGISCTSAVGVATGCAYLAAAPDPYDFCDEGTYYAGTLVLIAGPLAACNCG